jgi:hypothetical protein
MVRVVGFVGEEREGRERGEFMFLEEGRKKGRFC